MAQVDSNSHLRSEASSSGFLGRKRPQETTSRPQIPLLASQWAPTRRPKAQSQPQLRQVAPTRSRCAASRDAPLSFSPRDANHPSLRMSPLDARYTFAGPTQTDPRRNASQKFSPFASVRSAPTQRVGGRAALTRLPTASNRKISWNTSSTGNTSTNVSMIGWLDPGSYSAGIWSGQSQRPLHSPRKHPRLNSLPERSRRAKRRTRPALDPLVQAPRSAPSPLPRPNERESLSHLNMRTTLPLPLPPPRHQIILLLAQQLRYHPSLPSLSNGKQMMTRNQCTRKMQKERWM